MASPRLLKAFNSGSASTFTTVGQTLFFVGSEDGTGQELWASDGTSGGTRLVRDIMPGPNPSGIRALTALDGKLYFAASTTPPLWSSDGSASTTQPISGGFPPDLLYLESLGVFNSSLYFSAFNYNSSNTELYKHNSTTGAIDMLVQLPQLGSPPKDLTAVGNTLFFTASDGNGEELWKLNGSAAELVKDIQKGIYSSNPRYLTDIGSQLYFTAATSTEGWELWSSDGTENGTGLVADLVPGSGSSLPTDLTAIGSRLFFTAAGADSNRRLWVLDTSGARSTPRALTSDSLLNVKYTVAVGNTLYFTAGSQNNELWTSDGTPEGTKKAMEIDEAVSGINSPHVVGNKLYFSTLNTGSTLLYVLDLSAPPPPVVSPTLTIAALSADKSEGNSGQTPFTFRITRSGDLRQPSQALWRVGTTPAPTVSASDFVNGEMGGTVSFARDEDIKTLTVQVKGDVQVEPNESFYVSLTAIANGNAVIGTGTSSFANALIRNDDNGAPPPSDFASSWTTAMALVDWSKVNLLALLNALPKSPKSQFSISLPRLSAPPAQPSNYTLVFTGENMQLKDSSKLSAPSSWGGTVSKVELKSGSTSLASAALKPTALKDIAQKILADLLDSPRGLGQPTLQFLQQRLDVMQLSIDRVGPASQLEGRAGSQTPFTFTISRSGNDLSGSSTAVWAVTGSGGTPAGGDDFVAGAFPSGTVSFARNERSKTITIQVKGDSAVETDEAFSVTLSAPTGAVLAPTKTTATNTIINDDRPVVSLALENPSSVNEDGGQSLRYVFTRSVATNSPLVVNFAATTSGQNVATPGVDYTGKVLPPTAGFNRTNTNPLASITIESGSSQATLTITPKPDTQLEGDEKVTLTLKGPNTFSSAYTLPTQGLSKTGTIRNDDLPKVSLTIEGDSRVREDGPANLRFVFSREGSTTNPQVVNYSVSGTASPDSDYTGIATRGGTKSVTIPKGASKVTVTVDPKPDAVPDANETVVLTLAGGTGYSLGNTRSATGTITAPTVQPSDSGFLEGERISFNIQAPTNTLVSWDLTGTGVDDADFNFNSPSFRRSGQLNSGRDGKLSIGYLSRKDFKSEGPERLTLTLKSAGKEIGRSTVVLLDTSENPVVSTNMSQVDEGSTLETTFKANGIHTGNRIYWSLIGSSPKPIDATDLEMSEMNGSVVLDTLNSATVRHKIKSDLKTEGIERASIQFFADSDRKLPIGSSIQITIADSSAAAEKLDPSKPTYRLSSTKDHLGYRFAYYDSDKQRILYKDGPVQYLAWTPDGQKNLRGKPTFVYIHGWEDSTSSPNTRIIANALKNRYGKSANIVLIDWYSMSRKWSGRDPQPTAEASVTKQLGGLVADLLLKDGANPDNLTIIGHSLGSFVAAAAAEEISIKQRPINELVALDTAYASHGYDIDARNGVVLSGFASGSTNLPSVNSATWPTTGVQDFPLHFLTKYAHRTSSYTASDYRSGIPSSAGDNFRAATAYNAYIVQYTSADGSQIDIDNVPQSYHNGTIAVYADLIRKGNEHPNQHNSALNTRDKFTNEGRLGNVFDGVIIAPTPWSIAPNYRSGSVDIKPETRQAAPLSIGWTDSFDGGTIYGTRFADVLFYDGLGLNFSDAGVRLQGGLGNDTLGGGINPTRTQGPNPSDNTNNSRLKAVDILIGEEGADTFFFGYKRHGKVFYPYTDKSEGGFGAESYGVVADFNPTQGDKLQFAWPSNKIFHRNGGFGDLSIQRKWGSGVAFFTLSSDLIAYLPHVTTDQVNSWIGNGVIRYDLPINLDQALTPPPPHTFNPNSFLIS